MVAGMAWPGGTGTATYTNYDTSDSVYYGGFSRATEAMQRLSKAMRNVGLSVAEAVQSLRKPYEIIRLMGEWDLLIEYYCRVKKPTIAEDSILEFKFTYKAPIILGAFLKRKMLFSISGYLPKRIRRIRKCREQ